MNQLLTMQEVRELLRCGPDTIRRLINEDESFRTIKLKRRRLMSPEALEAFLRSKEQILPGQDNK